MGISSENIVRYWFEEIDKSLWFNSTPEFDDSLRARFHGVVDAALRGNLDSWTESSEGCLALVIALDQFPLNMFRGKPESFAGESKSRDIARIAIDKNFDRELKDAQKAFLYMPFMHSENISDQDLSVRMYQDAGLKDNLRFAKHHRDIIKRFGRFPHRNKILDRESTDEEIDYLNSKEAFLG